MGPQTGCTFSGSVHARLSRRRPARHTPARHPDREAPRTPRRRRPQHINTEGCTDPWSSEYAATCGRVRTGLCIFHNLQLGGCHYPRCFKFEFGQGRSLHSCDAARHPPRSHRSTLDNATQWKPIRGIRALGRMRRCGSMGQTVPPGIFFPGSQAPSFPRSPRVRLSKTVVWSTLTLKEVHSAHDRTRKVCLSHSFLN